MPQRCAAMRILQPDGRESRCDRCGGTNGKLVRYIIRSGATQVRFQCDACGRIQTFSLPRSLTGPPDGFPVALDRSGEVHCAVCNHPGAELHHFAPRHIFGDEADRWPVSYLCVPHHREWHRRMNVAMRLRRRAA